MRYSKEEFLQCIDAVLPLIEEQSEICENLGYLTDKVMQTLYETQVFHYFVSEKYGGALVELPLALKIFEKISYADGAAGWIAMLGAGGGVFSGFLQGNVSQAIFHHPKALIAGSGMPNGIASKVEGGYRVNGYWRYASGAKHATYFTANCRVEGSDEIIAVAIPANEVTIYDTWDVFGLKATGSHDFSVKDIFVKNEYTFTLTNPRLSDPIYKTPLEVQASLSFASVALGIGKHALHAFKAYASEKELFSLDTKLFDTEDVQESYTQAQKFLEQSDHALYSVADEVYEITVNGHMPDEVLKDKVHQCGIDVVQKSIQASDLLYFKAGMMPLFESSEFGRAWRDLHVLSQHILVAK